MSCGIGHRCGSDPALLWLWLWLWCRLAAVAPFRPLAWEPPYASGTALKSKKKKKKKKKNKNLGRPGTNGTPAQVRGPVVLFLVPECVQGSYILSVGGRLMVPPKMCPSLSPEPVNMLLYMAKEN